MRHLYKLFHWARDYPDKEEDKIHLGLLTTHLPQFLLETINCAVFVRLGGKMRLELCSEQVYRDH